MQRKYRFLWLALIIPLGAFGAFATGMVQMPWQAPEETPKTTSGRVMAPAKPETPVKQAAVQSPAKQPAASAPADAVKEALKPKGPFGIDVARLNGDGSSVIAGYGKPGELMTVMADGKPVGVVTPDSQGDWVLVTAYKFAHLDPKLSLKFGNHVRKEVAALKTMPKTMPKTDTPSARSSVAAPKPTVAPQPPSPEAAPPKRRAADVTNQMLERLKQLTKEAEAQPKPAVTSPAKSKQQVASFKPAPTLPEIKPAPSVSAAAQQPKATPSKTTQVAALTKQQATVAPKATARDTTTTAPADQPRKAKPAVTAPPSPTAEAPTAEPAKDTAVAKAPVATPRTTPKAVPEENRASVNPPKVKIAPLKETAPEPAAAPREAVNVAKAQTTSPSETEKAPVTAPPAAQKPLAVTAQSQVKAPAKVPAKALAKPPAAPAKTTVATPSSSENIPTATTAPSDVAKTTSPAATAAASSSSVAAGPASKAAPSEPDRANLKVAAAKPAATQTPQKATNAAVTNLPVPVQFVYRKAVLTPKGREAAALLLKYFLAKDFKYVVLSGHADERGTNQANMVLSKQRLLRIERLLREGGFQGRLKLVPKGETEKYTGVDRSQFDIEELWQLDRRVEVVSASTG